MQPSDRSSMDPGRKPNWAVIGRPLRHDPSLEDVAAILDGNDYEVKSFAGSGGMGAVYKVYNNQLGRCEALKLMRPVGRDPSLNQRLEERFQKEIKILASLDHPCITPVYHSGGPPEGGYRWFTMAWLEGETLADLLERNPPGPAQIIEITRQMLLALEYLHLQGLIHRDLKPGNIMICRDGSVRLLDFGIACPTERSTHDLTQTGEFIGSPKYSSPERLSGRNPTVTDDLYAVGRVLEEMINKIKSKSIAESAFPGDYDLVKQLTDVQPNKRPQSAREVLPRLEDDSAAATWSPDLSPFPGLEAYQPNHAPVYFGREDSVRAGLRLLQDAPDNCAFLLIAGASGSGKSSLARAGIAPRAGHGKPPLICTPEVLSPRSDCLLPDLGRRLAQHQWGTEDKSEEIACALRGSRGSLAHLLNINPGERASSSDSHDRAPPGLFELCIVVDQFESLYRRTLPSESNKHFVRGLERLARTPGVAVIVTLRSDALHHVAEEPFRALVTGRQLLLSMPQPWELVRLLRCASHAAGLAFERRSTAEALDDRLVADASASSQNLPLLSFVLQQLWLHRVPPAPQSRASRAMLSFDAYERMGGINGAVAAEAQKVHDKFRTNFPEHADSALDHLLFLLVSNDGSPDVRFCPSDELDAADEHVKHLARYFVDSRLCVQDSDGIALGHGALLSSAVVDRWPALKAWIDRNAEELRLRNRIGVRAADWNRGGRHSSDLIPDGLLLAEASQLNSGPRGEMVSTLERDYIKESEAAACREEAKREARAKHDATVRRRVLIGFAAAAAISLGFAALSWHQRREALQRENEAVAARQTSEEMRKSADILLINSLDSLRKAIESELDQGKLGRLATICEGIGKYYDALPPEMMDSTGIWIGAHARLLEAEVNIRHLNGESSNDVEGTVFVGAPTRTNLEYRPPPDEAWESVFTWTYFEAIKGDFYKPPQRPKPAPNQRPRPLRPEDPLLMHSGQAAAWAQLSMIPTSDRITFNETARFMPSNEMLRLCGEAISSAREAVRIAPSPRSHRSLAVALYIASKARGHFSSEMGHATAQKLSFGKQQGYIEMDIDDALEWSRTHLLEAQQLMAKVNAPETLDLDSLRLQSFILLESGLVAREIAANAKRLPRINANPEALQYFTEARTLLESHLARDPDHATLRRDLVWLLNEEASAFLQSDPPDLVAALQRRLQALDTVRWLSTKSPSDLARRVDLARALGSTGVLLARLGKAEESGRMFSESVELYEDAARRQAESGESSSELVAELLDAHLRRGDEQFRATQFSQALESFASAQGLVQEFGDLRAREAQDQEMGVGVVHRETGCNLIVSILRRLVECHLRLPSPDIEEIRTLARQAEDVAKGEDLSEKQDLKMNLKAIRDATRALPQQ